MARPKKGVVVTPTVFKNAPVYPPTKKQIDSFCKKSGLGIAQAMKRIIPMGIEAYSKAKEVFETE